MKKLKVIPELVYLILNKKKRAEENKKEGLFRLLLPEQHQRAGKHPLS